MKIVYLHNLPIEYYPPASNFLDLLGQRANSQAWAFTTGNRKGRNPYRNKNIKIIRTAAPNPGGWPLLRLLITTWWHVKSAFSLFRLNPDAVLYVEPHSAIAAWIYYRILGGRARLFIHHHEYYETHDFQRPGMRIPRLGKRLERNYLFARAEWVSQTNEDRLNLARQDHPEVSVHAWHILPNFPPTAWCSQAELRRDKRKPPFRMIYIGSASFEDTYIEEVVRWVAANKESAQLHICGYNVKNEVWDWLEKERFPNVSYDSSGYRYNDLPRILADFDVGLVIYKGNTTNFIYNVPNKMFEYLVCGLDVWFPKEMKGICNFFNRTPAPILKLDFTSLDKMIPLDSSTAISETFDRTSLTAEQAFAPLLGQLGMTPLEHQA